MKHYILVLMMGLLVSGAAQAQQRVIPCYSSGVNNTAGGSDCVQVSATNPLPVTGAGGGGGAVTVADGADVTQGALADAAAAPGGTGTVSAKLREVTALLNSILTGVTSSIPPPAGTPTQTTVTCGTSSALFLAASTATTFILIQSPADVWLDFSGNTAVLLGPSIKVSAGGSFMWGPTTFLPTAQINCKASVSTVVTLVYK